MKKFLRATAIALAVVVGTTPAALAHGGEKPDPKVWVCKYVGTPGVDETLKEGKNPITVSSNATVGTYFNDAQGRSYVLAEQTEENTGQGNTYIGELTCPEPEGPPEPELFRYRVVAGMPRYRGEVFFAPDGVTCESSLRRLQPRLVVDCEGHIDYVFVRPPDATHPSGTYVRLRQIGEPGPYIVLLDWRK